MWPENVRDGRMDGGIRMARAEPPSQWFRDERGKCQARLLRTR